MTFEQMEVMQGGKGHKLEGWNWSIEDHIACAVVGFVSGGGILGVLGYGACLWFAY